MRYYVAPLEGLTGTIFRRIHHRYFPGADKYYTPFLSPSHDHVFTKREKREILPEYNEGCLLYTSPSPRDRQKSRMPSSA